MNITEVMDRWKNGIAAHAPEAVAATFAEDAIFQGLKPYGVGREAVAKYYDSQPVGMTVDYQILETREIAEDVLLGYFKADFSFVDRPTPTLYLSVLVKGDLIAHYQVSQLG
ncbi:hypothetical protein JNUCC0626_02075 [Lentzea sp. JNUCC 0626]|uniref:hypothetical protein n=1 Tax=Lentzea sp. JNUCC 0626 TaxID=3367513 RepID=UPI003748ECBC